MIGLHILLILNTVLPGTCGLCGATVAIDGNADE